MVLPVRNQHRDLRDVALSDTAGLHRSDRRALRITMRGRADLGRLVSGGGYVHDDLRAELQPVERETLTRGP